MSLRITLSELSADPILQNKCNEQTHAWCRVVEPNEAGSETSKT